MEIADSSIRLRRSFFGQNWPYIVMLALALSGVAITSVARQAMTSYWVVLAPIFAALCIFARWRDAQELDLRSIWMDIFHWIGVMVAMYLVFIGDVRQMMNADATALVILTILALGTFSAGIQVGAWRVCFVGFALALGVPIIAWIDEATLLLLLLALVVLAFIALLFFHARGERAADNQT
jgi:hypothetical protein